MIIILQSLTCETFRKLVLSKSIISSDATLWQEDVHSWRTCCNVTKFFRSAATLNENNGSLGLSNIGKDFVASDQCNLGKLQSPFVTKLAMVTTLVQGFIITFPNQMPPSVCSQQIPNYVRKVVPSSCCYLRNIPMTYSSIVVDIMKVGVRSTCVASLQPNYHTASTFEGGTWDFVQANLQALQTH